MSIEWNDSSKPNMRMMMDDAREYDKDRYEYTSTLARSLNGLSLEEAEAKIEQLAEGYRAYAFTQNGEWYSFRVRKTDALGWDGITFTLDDSGHVQAASTF